VGGAASIRAQTSAAPGGGASGSMTITSPAERTQTEVTGPAKSLAVVQSG
jgi:hypothetical protein